MGSIEVTTCADAAGVAATAAHDALEMLIRLQQERPEPQPVSLVLTGGGVGIDVQRAMRASPLLHNLDWSRVEIWWSDERHVAPDDVE